MAMTGMVTDAVSEFLLGLGYVSFVFIGVGLAVEHGMGLVPVLLFMAAGVCMWLYVKAMRS